MDNKATSRYTYMHGCGREDFSRSPCSESDFASKPFGANPSKASFGARSFTSAVTSLSSFLTTHHALEYASTSEPCIAKKLRRKERYGLRRSMQ